MSIFAKSLKAIKEFDLAMKTAAETHAEAKKNILANYAGNLLEQKLAEINDTLRVVEMEQKVNLKEVLAADFAQATEKIKATAVADVPADFLLTLEAIKALTKTGSITDFETKAFLEKYRTSYMAARAVAETLIQSNHGGNYTIVQPDVLLSDVKMVQGKLDNWLYNWNPNDYMSRLMVADSNILTGLDERVSSWLDGGFVHIA